MFRLLADRFVCGSSDEAWDLATGRRVMVRTRPAVPAVRGAWRTRCAELVRLRHPHVVPLVDWSESGQGDEAAWLELYAPSLPDVRASARGGHALASAVAVLHRLDLAAGAVGWPRLRLWNGRPAFLPDATTGLALDDDAERRPQEAASLRSCLEDVACRPSPSCVGLRLRGDPLLDGLLETLDTWSERRLSLVPLDAPRGVGLTRLLELLAAEARRRGFVPVCPAAAPLVDRLPELRGRALVLLVDRPPGQAAAPSFPGSLVMRWTRAGRIVAMVVGVWQESSGRCYRLAPWSGGDLADAVVWPTPPAPRAGIDEGARRAGAPGPFVEWLSQAGYWCGRAVSGASAAGRPADIGLGLIAAEQRELYGRAEARAAALSAASGQSGRAAAPDDPRLARAQADVGRARALAGRGRRAEAETLLRTALGTLRRRGRSLETASAAMTLGRVLARSGHVQRAMSSFRQAADLFALEQCPTRANDATRAMGVMQLDAAEFEAAARLLRAAEAEAAGRGDAGRRALAQVELLRCAFWQARFAEVEDRAARLRDAHPAVRVRACAYESLALVASQRIARAGQVLRALEATPAGPRLALVEWHAAHAVLQTRVGNREAAARLIRAGIAAARRAALPLAALVCRALGLLASRARGPTPRPGRVEARLARVRRLALPALVRACIEHAVGRRPAGRRDEPVAAVLDALFEGGHDERAITTPLLDVLRVCQEARDDTAGLETICRSLCRELEASAVAVVGGDPVAPMVGTGRLGRAALEACRTALDAGTTDGLTATSAGLVGAVPVRVAGTTTAALAAGWAPGATPDGRRAVTLLASVAAAAAPLVRAVVDGRDAVERAVPVDAVPGLLGVSRAMGELRQAVARAAAAPFPVLIEGESGSGKELVARAIHQAGPRRLRRFCPVNCAALPDDLLDAELFGHVRGAFTGALHDRPGVFEEADGGTLFLDEVGELSPRAQAKLLRALQEGEVRRVGESLPRLVDARIVAASNQSLSAAVEDTRFRGDLRYRLDVIHIVVPPLRARREDIAVLARHYWDDVARCIGSGAALAPETLAALARYDWPGNVRELQNVLMGLAVSAPARGRVAPRALPEALAAAVSALPVATLDAARRAFEERYVRGALARSLGCRARAARELGLTRQGLQKVIVRLGIGGTPGRKG